MQPLSVYNAYLGRLGRSGNPAARGFTVDTPVVSPAPNGDLPMSEAVPSMPGGYDIVGPSPDISVSPLDAPSSDASPAPAPSPDDTMFSGPMKKRPVPSAIAEGLVADSAGGVHSPWEALGKLSEFGVGTLLNKSSTDKQTNYDSGMMEELRHSLSEGKTIDEAMKSSSYPELWKLWLTKEMNPSLATKSQTGDWENYIHSLAPGETPTGEGFKAYQISMRGAGATKVTMPGSNVPLPALEPGKMWKLKADGTLDVGPDGPEQIPIKGSKEAVADETKADTNAKYAAITSDEIGRSLDLIQNHPDDIFGLKGAIGGAIGGIVGGTYRTRLDGLLNTIKSSITIERLGEARAGSATGASGFGALSDQEGKLLSGAKGAIDTSVGAADLKYNLMRLQVITNLIMDPPVGPDGKMHRMTEADINAAMPADVRAGIEDSPDDSEATSDDIAKELERRKAARGGK